MLKNYMREESLSKAFAKKKNKSVVVSESPIKAQVTTMSRSRSHRCHPPRDSELEGWTEVAAAELNQICAEQVAPQLQGVKIA